MNLDAMRQRSIYWAPIILVLLFLFAHSNPALASSDEGRSHTFVIAKDFQQAKLGHRLRYFVESSSEVLNINDLGSPSFNARFQALGKEEANFGFVDAAYWFKLSLQDLEFAQRNSNNWYLELDYPFLDDVQVYIPNGPNSYLETVVGDSHPFDKRDIDLHVYLFPLQIESPEVQDIYLRVETSTSLQMPLTLWSEHSFIEQNAVKQYWLGVFYGIMLVMILYNAFIYLSVRDNAYILYILYIVCVMITNMSITGVAFQKIWPNSPTIANMGFALSSATTMFFALQFTRSFLQTQNYGAHIDSILKLMAGLALLMLSFPYLLGTHIATVLAVFMPIPTCLVIVGAGLYGMILKHRRAFFFVSAWGCLIIGFIGRSLLQFDLVPNVFVTQYGTQLGSIAEVILLSLALADRINTEKAEKLEAVKASLEAYKKKQAVEQELIFQSCHDQLTGAPNRSLYVQRLRENIDQTDAQQWKIMVCTVHLDNFHDINFTLGHQAGDRILLEAVKILDQELSQHAGIRRLNGHNEQEAYIGMMEGVYLSFILRCDPDASEHQVLEPLMQRLSQPLLFDEMTLDLGAHIGVANWPNDDNTAIGLTRKSMIAVRAAKWSRIPLVCYDANIDKYSEARLSLMGELITAIENDELVLHYQPKIDLRNNRVVGMEALVRWQHPKLGLLGPDHFVDIAESTGVIQALTQWVLNAALKFCNTLRDEGHDFCIAVNLSVRNLLNEQFVPMVLESTRDSRFPREKLILEVVESAVIEDMEQATKSLEALHTEGIQLSLDDFGTGYSSLSYLKKLPIQELKLDRSFVTNLIENRDDQVIVETTIAIAKQLRLQVVAEGIEDGETLTRLAGIGCDIGQGYHIQKPLPEHEFRDWLHRYNYALDTSHQS